MPFFTHQSRSKADTPSAGPVALTDADFANALETHPRIVVDFWAPWCGPCRAFAPVFANAASRHPEILFAKVNVDESPNLARRLSIRSIPTIVTFVDQRPAAAQAGVLSLSALERMIEILPEAEQSTWQAPMT